MYVPSLARPASASSSATLKVLEGYVPFASYQRITAWYSAIVIATPEVPSYAPPLERLLSVMWRRAALNPLTALVEPAGLLISPTIVGLTGVRSPCAAISTRWPGQAAPGTVTSASLESQR